MAIIAVNSHSDHLGIAQRRDLGGRVAMGAKN
jgi:hypothetical protein